MTPTAVGRVWVLARRFTAASVLNSHEHDAAQLLFAASGLMQVRTPRGQWLVPPQRAVWLPPDTRHSIEMLTPLEMRSVYIAAADVATHPHAGKLAAESVVAVDDFLRELILTLFTPGCHPERAQAALTLILFGLLESQDTQTFLPLPSDPRARRIAELAMADPAGLRPLPELAREAGISQRTAARVFPAETGLTFKQWRQRARMMAAVEALGRKRMLVKQIAATLGFSSVAAFTASFRAVFGVTPTTFQERLAPR